MSTCLSMVSPDTDSFAEAGTSYASTSNPPPRVPEELQLPEHASFMHSRIASAHEAVGSCALISGHTRSAHWLIWLIWHDRQSKSGNGEPPVSFILNTTVTSSLITICPSVCFPALICSTRNPANIKDLCSPGMAYLQSNLANLRMRYVSSHLLLLWSSMWIGLDLTTIQTPEIEGDIGA